jgi:hypothetical protein
VADELVVGRVQRIISAEKVEPALSVTETALLSTATGLGHLLGLDDEDLALDGVLTNEEVVSLISTVWRGGRVPGKWSVRVLETYQSLFICGRDTGTVRPSILEALADTQLHARLSEFLPQDELDATPSTFIDELCAAAVEFHADAELPDSIQARLDEPRWHLPLVAWLLEQLPKEAERAFTPLELRAIARTSMDTTRGQDIDQWCRMSFIPMSIPGAWPARAGGDVPPWIREEVIEMGARFAYASTGNVPGWFVTSESDDEQRAFQSWTYNPGFYWRAENSTIEVGFVLRFADGDHALVGYRYSVDDYIRLFDLRSMLATGVVRVDHYIIDSEARLRHVQAFGTPLPPQLIAECEAALAELTSGQEAQLRLALTETADVLEAMAIVDRNGLEGLEIFTDSQGGEADSEAGASYRRVLRLIDAATQDAMRGSRVDERLLAEARDELRVALARTERHAVPLDLARLGAGRAYIQLRLHQESLFLHCFVAYLDGDGSPVTHQFEFSDTIDLRSIPVEIEGCVSELAAGLAELRTLLSAGIESVVLRTSAALYGIPWHEALLRLGFAQVSFVHRLNSLAVSSPTLPASPRALVRGYADTGRAHLAAVSTELKTIATLYETAFRTDTIPDVVHLSGHAVTGGASYSVAIADGPDRPLSSARVLLDWKLSGTAVVVLSACNTGTVDVALDQVLEVLPLDVAFISAGAAAVVSTCAPVNDNVAAAFACAFHYELAAGVGVWKAYLHAREFARGDAPDRPMAAWLDEQWPAWRVDLGRGLARAPHDWQLFRMVGRHW